MASFTINFQANTSGNHIIGYRTYNDPVNTYTVITVNVLTAPAPQAVVIDVPGNLYCGQIIYDCYVVAGCKLNDEATLIATGVPDPSDDAGGDGFPDAAIGTQVTLDKQPDPCTFVTVTCDNVPIGTIDIDAGGGGTGYTNGDSLLFTGAFLVEAVGTVSVSGGIITGINLTNPGSYQVAPTVTVTSGGGAGASLSVVMLPCPIINLTDHQCQNDDAGIPPVYSSELGEEFGYCIDIGTVSNFDTNYVVVPSDYCHCRECESYSVTNPTGSDAIATVQQCWDSGGDNFQTTTFTIPAGQTVPTGCAVKGTLVLENSDLTFTIAAC